jgi:DNA-binding CsgD family transcriptional regulator
MDFGVINGPVARTRLLDRQTELERLQRIARGAEQGLGAVVLVEGEAGIGKSALLSAAAEAAAERGLRVLKARGGELETGFAYGLMRQLLESELLSARRQRRERLLMGAAALATPVLGPPGGSAQGEGGQYEPLALEHGLYWLLCNLADERPLVLLLDDLHWADMATLRFLVYLARRIDELPLAVIGCVRLGDGGARCAPLELLRSVPVVQSLEPQPLSQDSVALIASETLSGHAGPEIALACHGVTGGNPFLLSELMLTLVAEEAQGTAHSGDLVVRVRDAGPPAVSRSVLQRLAGTSGEAIALADAIAVTGSGAPLHHAAALAGLPMPAAMAAAEQLIDARVLAPERPLGFRHPLLRSTIYAHLPAPRRAREHKRAARLLADDGEDIDAVAGHLLLTEPDADSWVVGRLREAAAAALARAAPEPAVRYLERALAEPPEVGQRAPIMLALGSAKFHAGDPAGLDVLGDALALAHEPRQRALIALELGSLLYYFGDIPKAVAMMEGAATSLDPTDELAERLEAMLLAVAGLDISTHELVKRRLDPSIEDLPGLSAHERLLLAIMSLHVSCGSGPASRAASIAKRAVGGGKLFAEQPSYAVPLLFPIDALIFSDEFDAAGTAIEQVFAQAQDRGSLVSFSLASWARGWLNHRVGALCDAATDLRISWSYGREGGWEDAQALGTGLLIEALVDAGDVAGAEVVLSEVDERFHAASTTVARLFLLEGRGRLRLAQGNARGALEDLLELGRLCDEWGWLNPAHHRWRSEAALASMRLGECSVAHRLAVEEVERARSYGAPRAIAIALRVLALVEGGSRGIELLREAAEVIDASPARLVRAEVLVDLGGALRRAGQRAAARQPLRAGLADAHRCGARVLVERAQIELQATGARPRSLSLVGAEALTPSERRVCALVSDGHSNPEVAQLLFVTRGTVEAHLRSAYRKLHISSRTELARALSDGAAGSQPTDLHPAQPNGRGAADDAAREGHAVGR